MAKQRACIDRELFDLVKEYSKTHDKDKCCAHFQLSLSFLNKILRYNSYEEMRFTIRERARERYAENKKKKEAEKAKIKEEKMPEVKPPIALPAPAAKEPQEDWEQRYKEVMDDYKLIKARNDELQTEIESLKQQLNRSNASDMSHKSDITVSDIGELVIEMGRIKITCKESSNAKN